MTREEAIKELRSFIGQLTEGCQEAIKVLIPELKESKDERIRKELVDMINECTNWIHKKEYVKYLEKQKENPKSAGSISSDCTSDAKCENKHNEEGDFVFELRQIISSHRYSDIYGEYTNDEEGMASEILELCKCELEKQKEQKQPIGEEYTIEVGKHTHTLRVGSQSDIDNLIRQEKQKQPEVDLEKFTEKIKTFQGRYKHPEIVSIKGAMAFMARMFYQYPDVARQWYEQLPKATMD